MIIYAGSLKNREQQLDVYSDAIKMYSNKSIAYALRSKVYFEMLEYEFALNDINYAIHLSPQEQKYYEARIKIKEALNFRPEELDIDRKIIDRINLHQGLSKATMSNVKKGFEMNVIIPWLVSTILPTVIIFIFQFGIPSMFHSIGLTNLLFCYFVAFVFIIGAYIALVISSPHILCTLIITTLYGILLMAMIFDLKEKMTKHFRKNTKEFWKCLACGTENSGDHVQCWKCNSIKNEMGK